MNLIEATESNPTHFLSVFKSPHSQQIQDHQQIESHETNDKTVNLKNLVYQKTQQFWLQRMSKARQKNNPPDQPQKYETSIRKTIRIGLQVQQYLSQATDFYNLYVQQIQNDIDHSNYSRPKVFVRKAKLMLKLFLDKNQQAQLYFLYPLNWVRQRLTSYPHIIKHPICIKQIQKKLKNNLYESFDSFLVDMDQLFSDFLLFNLQNQAMTQVIIKLRNNWTTIKYEVLQLKNFAMQSFINPSDEFVHQMMDIDEEINILREKVSVDKNVSEYLDYDPDYFAGKQPPKGLEQQNKIMGMNREQNGKKLEQKKKSNEKSCKTQERRTFESFQSVSRVISKQRLLQLKKDISKCIVAQMSQKDLSRKRLLKYIDKRKRQNPNFIGSQNQIDLESLQYEEFLELEQMVMKFMTEM